MLLQEYTDGRLPVAHFDTYRLGDIDEFLAIGGDEYLFGSSHVCIVEWAERIGEVLPDDHILIEIKQTAETGRHFTIRTLHPDAAQIVLDIESALNRPDTTSN